MEHLASLLALIGIVIIVSSLVSGAVERSGLPQVAIFLALGAILGPWGLHLVDISLDSAAMRTIATLGLVLVLFSDAISVNTRELVQQRSLALRVLGPGTLIPAVLLALTAMLLLDLDAPHAFILGAALASTDPVLLRTVLRHRPLPEPARLALRLESGMNDAVLLPLIVVSMLFIALPGESQPNVVRSLLGLFLLGPVLGAGVGWLGIIALVRIRDRVGVRRDYESLYALGIAFTAFAAAESVGGSGFVAAFAAGLVIAVQDLELCDCFLEYGEATAEMFLLLTFVAFGTAPLWRGFEMATLEVLIFAAVALVMRTITLYPVLSRVRGLDARSRRLIVWMGPRGLSSLLLILLPVFAGVPGAEELFAITALVVMISVVVHGVGIAVWLRRDTADRGLRIEEAANRGSRTADRGLRIEEAPIGLGAPKANGDVIGIDEVRARQAAGERLVVVDARSERTWGQDGVKAQGAVRIPPGDVVRTAKALGLSHHGTVVVYCA